MKTKICKECGKEFTPKFGRQEYCNDEHFRPCPVCGKPVKVKVFSEPPKACSYECRAELRRRTSLERYGIESPTNTPEANEKRLKTLQKQCDMNTIKMKRRQTLMERYGIEFGHELPHRIKDKVSK